MFKKELTIEEKLKYKKTLNVASVILGCMGLVMGINVGHLKITTSAEANSFTTTPELWLFPLLMMVLFAIGAHCRKVAKEIEKTTDVQTEY